jgi:hypothetical protein
LRLFVRKKFMPCLRAADARFAACHARKKAQSPPRERPHVRENGSTAASKALGKPVTPGTRLGAGGISPRLEGASITAIRRFNITPRYPMNLARHFCDPPHVRSPHHVTSG